MTHQINSALAKRHSQPLTTGLRKLRSLSGLRYGAIAVVSAIFMIGMSAPLQAADHGKDSGSYIFDILYVNRGPDKDHISAFKDEDYRNEVKVYEHYVAQNTIQWALTQARVVVVTDGGYKITKPITIKKPGSRLVIGPKATIQGSDKLPRHASVIEVNRADNVQVFNLGTLKGNGGAGIQFNGQTGGESGIDGGMIFSSGKLTNVNAGCWMIDTANINIPFALADENMYSVLGMEGVHDAEIGTVCQLTKNGGGEGAAVEVTMNNKRVNINRVIAPAPKPGDEIVHFNNSHDIKIENVTALTGGNDKDHSVVKTDLYDDTGLLYQLERNRPLYGMRTERPLITDNSGLSVGKTERIGKEVSGFSKDITYPGFPDSLPTLKVKVKLKVNFKDGSSTEVFSNKYEFDLSE